MPTTIDTNQPSTPKRLGLALSGGGYRAAAFHLGTLKKLHQMDILSKIDVISTISGGSITGAYYALNSVMEFEKIEENMIKILRTKSVIGYVLFSWSFIKVLMLVLLFLGTAIFTIFTSYYWLAPIILVLLIVLLFSSQFRLFPISKEIEKAYDHFFYKKATLSNLPLSPILVINATNLQTSRQFIFSKSQMGDSVYKAMNPPINFTPTHFPVSRAVAASASVPFAFTPVLIDPVYFADKNDAGKIDPRLVDGGVYDNQGIHKLTHKNGDYSCNIIMVSDAGNKLPFQKSYKNTITLLIRTVDVFMTRIKHLQMMQHLYRNSETVKKEIAYWSLGWSLDKCISGFIDNLKTGSIINEVIEAHQLNKTWVEALKKSPEDQKLIRQIEDQLKKNVDFSLINDLNEEELALARKVVTNLTKLTTNEIHCLMNHAANMTELQIKLYCPSLIKK